MSYTGAMWVFLLLFAELPVGSLVRRECVAPPPPCDALKAATYVFLADIATAGSELEGARPNELRFVPQPVEFHVVEAFKGVSARTRRVEARILSDNAEAILFRTGKRYLVYASSAPDGL